MSEGLVEWLRAQLDEDEAWAKAAKGVHWQWVYNETDEVITPDPMLGEFLEATSRSGDPVVVRMDLRSVEEKTYPPETGYGSLPIAWPIHSAEEIDPSAAGHIANWDPSRVLREVEAKRKIIDRYEQALDAGDHGLYTQWEQAQVDALYEVISCLAAVYRDTP